VAVSPWFASTDIFLDKQGKALICACYVATQSVINISNGLIRATDSFVFEFQVHTR
jgi:hypothetical protein